jgi:chemotaxis-related protein WspB
MVLAILFSVARRSYALPCHSVVEVVPLLELRAAPHAPVWLTGAFAYHGALVSVVDACQLLGGYACSERLSSRVALVRCCLSDVGEVIVGVQAERMTSVRQLDGNALLSTEPTTLAYLGPVLKQGAELVQLIDVEGFVRATRGALQSRTLVAGGSLAQD